MFEAHGRDIRMTRGDTGLLTLVVTGVTLTDNDRAALTAKKKGGGVLFKKIAVPEDNRVQFGFLNDETEKWKPGHYEWDVRFALDAVVVDDEVVNGREVITPNWAPGCLEVLNPVGVI